MAPAARATSRSSIRKSCSRSAFAGMEIELLAAYDAVIEEGPAHSGMSSLVDLVAVKRG